MTRVLDLTIKQSYRCLHDEKVTSNGLTLGNIMDCVDPERSLIGRWISRIITWFRGKGWIGTEKALEILNNPGKTSCFENAKQHLEKLGTLESLSVEGKKTLAKIKFLTSKFLSLKTHSAPSGSLFAEIGAIQDLIHKIENTVQKKSQPKQPSEPVNQKSEEKSVMETEDLEIKEPTVTKQAIKKLILPIPEELVKDASISNKEIPQKPVAVCGIDAFSVTSKETLQTFRRKLKDLGDYNDPTQAELEFETVSHLTFNELSREKGYHQVEYSQSTVKNRYQNILPFKHNVIGGADPAEYINASPISVAGMNYLASQGPKLNTVDDFLMMAVKAGSDTIVTLVMHHEKKQGSYMEKCMPYWDPYHLPRKLPDGSVFDLFSEELLQVDKDDNEQVIWKRVFTIQKEGVNKFLTQFHYYHWPDFGEPEGLVFDELMDAVDKHKPKGPIVVHCSAGVGRTGTFIAAHSCISETKAKLSQGHPLDTIEVNVVERIMEMRTQRAEMVQSDSQLMAIKSSLFRFYEKACAKLNECRQNKH